MEARVYDDGSWDLNGVEAGMEDWKLWSGSLEAHIWTPGWSRSGLDLEVEWRVDGLTAWKQMRKIESQTTSLDLEVERRGLRMLLTVKCGWWLVIVVWYLLWSVGGVLGANGCKDKDEVKKTGIKINNKSKP